MAVVQRIREYELQDVVGGGGMGEVYRARHLLLGQLYAVKVVHPSLMENEEIRARFLREAQTLQRLDHPNILRFVTLFEDEKRLFLVTELLQGKPLDACANGADAAIKADWFHQIVRGVAHAHRRGILHRDLKPGNIHVLPDGRVKILDFGIARAITSRALTAQGHLVGTPIYLPPEVILGDTPSSTAGPTWDVYTLGLLAYEIFVGRLPFDLDPNGAPLQLLNDLSRFYAKRSRGAELRGQPHELSKAWSQAIDRALLLDPSKRPADAGVLLRLLDADSPLDRSETLMVSTVDLAPEDATGIHVLRPPAGTKRPAAAGTERAGGAAVASAPAPAGPDVTAPRAVGAQAARVAETENVALPPSRRMPPWLAPAGIAFAAGLGLALAVSSGGPSSNGSGEAASTGTSSAPVSIAAVSPPTPSAAPVTEGSNLNQDLNQARPEKASPIPLALATPPAVDAGTLDFEPVAVGTRPRPPRPPATPPPSREPPRGGSEIHTVADVAPGASVGLLDVDAHPPAMVYIGDRYIGISPVHGRLMKPGEYEVKLVGAQPNNYRSSSIVKIKAGQRTSLNHDEGAPKRR